MLAYTVNDSNGVTRIHVRPLDRIESRVLPGTEGAQHPFWSPDGRSLAFVTLPSRRLMRIDIEAGAPRFLSNEVLGPWHGTWNQNGDILFLLPDGPARVSVEGGAATPVTSVDQQRGRFGAGFPFFLRDGQRFLIRVNTGNRSSIQLGNLGSMATTMVIDDVESAPILAPTPIGTTYLLFLRAPDLMAQEFDETSGTVRGAPVVLVSDIGQVASPTPPPERRRFCQRDTGVSDWRGFVDGTIDMG